MTFIRDRSNVFNVRPPGASAFTVRQTGTNATLEDTPEGLLFSATQRVSTEDSILADVAIPGGAGSAFSLTVGYIGVFGGQGANAGFFNYSICGICLYESSTVRIARFVVYGQSDGQMRFQLAYQTGLTSSGNLTSGFDVSSYPLLIARQFWMRVEDDGAPVAATNRTWSYSNDGRNFVRMNVQARNTGFTTAPDRVGLYLSAYNSNARMLVTSWHLTGP